MGAESAPNLADEPSTYVCPSLGPSDLNRAVANPKKDHSNVDRSMKDPGSWMGGGWRLTSREGDTRASSTKEIEAGQMRIHKSAPDFILGQ